MDPIVVISIIQTIVYVSTLVVLIVQNTSIKRQLMQTNSILIIEKKRNKLENYQRLIENFNSIFLKGIEDDDYYPVFGFDYSLLSEKMDKSEKKQFIYITMTLTYLEIFYLAKTEEVIDDSMWIAWERYLQRNIKNPLFSSYWNRVKFERYFTMPFTKYVDKYLESIKSSV